MAEGGKSCYLLGFTHSHQSGSGSRAMLYHGSLGDGAETVDEDVAGHVHRWA